MATGSLDQDGIAIKHLFWAPTFKSSQKVNNTKDLCRHPSCHDLATGIQHNLLSLAVFLLNNPSYCTYRV